MMAPVTDRRSRNSPEERPNTSKRLKDIERIQKLVTFADNMTNEFQSCVEIQEENGYSFSNLWWSRARITDSLARRRKEKEKGRTKRNVQMVSESSRFRSANSSDDRGNPAARRRDLIWPWTHEKMRQIDE